MYEDRLKHMKETLMCAVEMQLCDLDEVDAKELGEAIDMIKDLEEAIYYCTVTDAMKGNDMEMEWEMKKGDSHKSKEMEGESRMYYAGSRYPMSYADRDTMYARGDGRRRRANGQFYAEDEPVVISEAPAVPLAYAQGGSSGGNSYAMYARGGQGGGRDNSYADGDSSHAEMYADGGSSYASPMYADNGSSMYAERDSREGRSYNSRRMYMEAKDMKRDKATQLRELEKYMQELSQDVVEMINDASPEEKQYLEKKITALASKVGQMK